ncbi:MAG TPA: hypothetical protein VK364_10885, partial [Hymenobacter sp.]|nr:hypothetical protein [Hymenobacter sp.]
MAAVLADKVGATASHESQVSLQTDEGRTACKHHLVRFRKSEDLLSFVAGSLRFAQDCRQWLNSLGSPQLVGFENPLQL